MAIPLTLWILGAGYILVFVGILLPRAKVIKPLGGMWLITTAVSILINGVSGVDNLVTLSLGTISIGLGFYFLVEDSFSFTKQVDSFDQEDDGRINLEEQNERG